MNVTIKTLKKNEYVRVYNHSSSIVCLTLESGNRNGVRQVSVKPKNARGVAGYVDIHWNELQYINDNTDVFRNGTLRFKEEEQVAIYEYLAIYDWENILFYEVLEDIILHPTIEKLQRLIDCEKLEILERARAVITKIGNSDEDVEVSQKVIRIVNARHQELKNRKWKSEITVSPIKPANPANEEDVENLKDEIAILKEMVEKLSKEK